MSLRVVSFSVPVRLNRWVQQPRWLWGFVAAAGLCVLVYFLNSQLGEITPSNLWGISYGVAATLLMLGALALGARRRTMRWGLGRAQDWVQFHVYGGALFLVFVLMHAGFRWPRGRLTEWLMILSLWITVSGLLGVGLRRWIPHLMSSGLTIEVLYERIPELVDELRSRAEELVGSSSGALKDFYRKRVTPTLLQPRMRWVYFLDITGGVQSRSTEFAFLRKLLDDEERSRCDQLEAIYRTKLELDAHYTLQRALRWWLYAHVPFSLILLVLVAIHIFSVLRY